jgi:hypothetical protein
MTVQMSQEPRAEEVPQRSVTMAHGVAPYLVSLDSSSTT